MATVGVAASSAVLVEFEGEWFHATIHEVLSPAEVKVVYDDGTEEDVPLDRVSPPGAAGAGEEAPSEDSCNAEDERHDGGCNEDGAEGERYDDDRDEHQMPGDDLDIDALMAAAEAAGACDEANEAVADALPPSRLHWMPQDLQAPAAGAEAAGGERKRCRPPGLMTSRQAGEMALQATKTRRR